MSTFDQEQARYDNRQPDDDQPEPSEAQFDKAFDRLMNNTELLIEYIDDQGPDVTTIFQLIHERGLPAYTTSVADDDLRDRMQTTTDTFIEGYRTWLGERLAVEAEQVRQEAIDEARLDAEETAAADDELPW